MRQITRIGFPVWRMAVSKLPMRQITSQDNISSVTSFSKLPMRQITDLLLLRLSLYFSKLPMRQITKG